MLGTHRMLRSAGLIAMVIGAMVFTLVPAFAVTGGTVDTGNTYSNVALIYFYQSDGRFRCSGTLIAPTVVLTAAHCTYGDIGKVAVTFTPQVARDSVEREINAPRASDDSGPSDAVSEIGYMPADITGPKYVGTPIWYLGTAKTHPGYSDFTDVRNWNDTGVVILDQALSLPVTPLAPANYLNTYRQPLLNSTEFLAVGYGTEVRRSVTPPRPPLPESYPIVRRYTTEIGQKLTSQLLQTNGNEKDPRAGGGTCFGDSGGPLMKNGFLVADTSYGYTNNCRYLDGYQRVDIPVVRDWVLGCVANPACATKP